MKCMCVIDCNGFNYHLRDEQGEFYCFNIEFMNCSKKPKKGDSFFWSEKNCTDREERSTHRTYGPYTKEGYARHGSNVQETDFIVVVTHNDMYLLQRYYG